VRNIQLAKAALYSGARLLMDKMGIDATAKPSLDKIAPISKVPREVIERIKLEDYIEEDL
jgi:hypothetical protein